jgi:hypothetical protein
MQESIKTAYDPVKESYANVTAAAAARAAAASIAVPFGDPPGSPAYEAYQKVLLGKGPKVGHVQVVASHGDLCMSLLVLAGLRKRGSKLKAILVYPGAWLQEGGAPGEGEKEREAMARSLKLMEMASERWGITLISVPPIVDGGNVFSPQSYPLALALSLTDYDRLLFVNPSGVVVDNAGLDRLLLTPPPETGTITTFTSETHASAGKRTTEAILFQPSLDAYDKATSYISMHHMPPTDSIFLREVYKDDTKTYPISSVVYCLRQYAESERMKFNPDPLGSLKEASFVHISKPIPSETGPVRFADFEPEEEVVWKTVLKQMNEQKGEFCGI